VTAAQRTVGIDIGGTAIKLAVVRDDGRIERDLEIPTQVEAGPRAAEARILDAVRRLQQDTDLANDAMPALGIACAGIIDPQALVVLDAPNLRNWEREPFTARIGEALGVRAFLENDVQAMTYGEWRCGAGRGVRDLLCLTLGTGVGGGLVLDGRPYRGARGAGGEVGHLTLDRDGPACPCGSRGCLERYVAAQAIVARAEHWLERDARPSTLRDLAPAARTPGAIGTAAAAGDAVAIAILAETGAWLGVGLASLVNVLNPERIVVGGGIAAAGDFILEPARRVLRERAMSVPAATVTVVAAALGNRAAVVGAALSALGRARAT
jgi:glucokinase